MSLICQWFVDDQFVILQLLVVYELVGTRLEPATSATYPSFITSNYLYANGNRIWQITGGLRARIFDRPRHPRSQSTHVRARSLTRSLFFSRGEEFIDRDSEQQKKMQGGGKAVLREEEEEENAKGTRRRREECTHLELSLFPPVPRRRPQTCYGATSRCGGGDRKDLSQTRFVPPPPFDATVGGNARRELRGSIESAGVGNRVSRLAPCAKVRRHPFPGPRCSQREKHALPRRRYASSGPTPLWPRPDARERLSSVGVRIEMTRTFPLSASLMILDTFKNLKYLLFS